MSAATQFVQLDVLGGALDASPMHRTPVRAHMRRVKGDAPPSGRQRRDAALAKHEEDAAKRVALTYIRARLVDLYRSRLATNPDATVNADDADELLREWSACPAEVRALRSQNWRGKIFAARGWEKRGDTPSIRPHMHATPIACWRFVEKPARPRVRHRSRSSLEAQ
jgi:hypothetical protein